MPPDESDSGSFWKLLCHFIDDLSWSMLGPLGLVTFFFFYGATNAAIKFTGRNLASFETPPGPAVGLVCAGFIVAGTALIKLRPRK
jgi:cytosine/uracil/thiamine/allantoin permease